MTSETMSETMVPKYEDICKVLLFLVFLFVGGKAATRVAAPALVGELFIGILLGPNCMVTATAAVSSCGDGRECG